MLENLEQKILNIYVILKTLQTKLNSSKMAQDLNFPTLSLQTPIFEDITAISM